VLLLKQATYKMLDNFYAIGVSYIKTDAETRGKFSIDGARGESLSQDALAMGIEALLVISTCNRTELYGFAASAEQLIDLLCKHTKGDAALFKAEGYLFQNEEAVSHLFRVGTGLDSQILGDFEIISQIKQAFRRSKGLKLSNVFLERLVNAVIQASKQIKNQTEISSGATSVSFASVRYLLENIPDISQKSLLLFGTGKIGRNTCENLVKHTSNKHITLINRTRSTAEEIAGKFELNVKGYEDLQTEIRKADVLIVATGAQKPTVTKALLYLKKPLTILDLSVPKNVASEVAALDQVNVVDIDDLSKITDDTLERRKSQVPLAEAIIAEIQGEFLTWVDNRKFAATIAALKERLSQFKEEERAYLLKKSKNTSAAKHSEVIDDFGDRLVQKITKQFANFLRASDDDLEQKMQLIEDLFELEKESE
jgi:glutamyl-tRNA reductase